MRSSITIDQKYRKNVFINEESYRILKAIQSKKKLNQIDSEMISTTLILLNKTPLFSTRVRNRCTITGRGRGVYKNFKLSRIKVRELALNGDLASVRKRSFLYIICSKTKYTIMLQNRSKIQIIDNTDVLEVRCFQPNQIIKLGDIIAGSVIKISKNKSNLNNNKTPNPLNQFKRGDVIHALIVNVTTPFRNSNGIYTSFGQNAGVIMINSGKEGWTPVGNRVLGVVPRSLREKGWSNIVSIAEFISLF